MQNKRPPGRGIIFGLLIASGVLGLESLPSTLVLYDPILLSRHEGIAIAQMDPVAMINGNFSLYYNSTYGIKILYPHTWKTSDNMTAPLSRNVVIVKFSNDSHPFSPSLTVSVDNISGESLDTYRADTIQSYRQDQNYQGFSLIQSTLNSVTLLGTKNTYSIEFTYTDPTTGASVINYEIGTLIAKRVYYVTYTSEASQFDQYNQVAQQMVDSFTIILPRDYLNSTQQGSSYVPEI